MSQIHFLHLKLVRLGWFVEKVALVVILLGIIGVGYFWFSRPSWLVSEAVSAGALKASYFMLPQDVLIPLVPWFAVYYIVGLYAPITYLLFFLKSRERFYRAMINFLVSAIIAFFIFDIDPTPYPRPLIKCAQDFCDFVFSSSPIVRWPEVLYPYGVYLLDQIYKIDGPYCTFPSLHMAFVTGYTLYTYEENKKVGFLFLINLVIVWLSTLLTKQHFILDGLAGIFIFWVSYLFVKKYLGKYILDYTKEIIKMAKVS